MSFSAIVSVWPTRAETYNLFQVVQSPDGTDVTINGDLSPSLKTEIRAVLLQLCDGTVNLGDRANILLDALDDLVVTDTDDNVITSQAAVSGDNRTISLTIAGSVTLTKGYLRVVMPQTLVGIYAGTTTEGDIYLQTGVAPGTYTNATITVRADGRIEFAETGTGGTGTGGGSLSPGSVTSTYLATGAVVTAKIADSAVTDAKIAGVAAAKVTGLSAVATSGSYTDLTGTPDLSGYLTASSITGKLDATTAASTYLTQNSATSTYATKTDLTAKLDSSTAATTYATKTALNAKLDSTAAASTYLTQTDATSAYATKTDLALAQQAVFYKQACATRVSSVSAASTYLAANQSARVLVDSGTAAVNNGIYVYDVTAGYKRASDFDGDPVSEVSPGAMVYVNDASIAYVCNSTTTPAVVGGVITGTTSWAIYSKAEVLTASNGIARSGNALSLDTTSATFKAAVAYDIGMDYVGRPALSENMVELTLPRAITLAAPTAHYVKTLVSGDRPAANNGSVLTVYRNSTAVLTISYQTTGVAVVAEPGSTVRSFAAGDVLKVTCTTYDTTAKNHKLTLCASLV